MSHSVLPAAPANESRRRAGTDAGSDHEPAPLNESPAAFEYQPLDTSVDCTRLLKFEPVESADNIPRCKLTHVTFGELPKYEALSYMWGDETHEKMIYINGQGFKIGQNLWDALQFLRKRPQRQRYWIDAISINQNDIPERNRQLRNMPQIYKRADRTLIWLGQKCFEENPKLASDSEPCAAAIQLYRELWADPYWDRVWIVQEISLATNIHVCLSGVEWDWDLFLDRIKHHVELDGTRGPLKLEKQRRERYELGHTLLRVLETHQDAVCKDRRDKIYGFVGLAVDSHGLPMDYRKTTFEVWKDIMFFANTTEEFTRNENKIFSFSKLVKRLLGGDDVAPVDRVVREYVSWTGIPEDIYIAGQPFKVPVFVVGTIAHIGSSPKQIRSVLDKEREWTAKVSKTFSKDIGAATLESDILIRALVSRKNIDFDLVTFPSPRFRWSFRDSETKLWPKIWDTFSRNESTLSIPAKHHIKSPVSEAEISKLEPHLFQLVKADSSKTPRKMGVAAGNARTGDWICWMEEVQKAVLIRFEKDGKGLWVSIIGTAKFTKDICKEANLPDDIVKNDYYLRMDVETAYILLT